MSRIDQALRVWEGAKGTESPVVDPTPSPLGDYPLEDARQAPPEPVMTPPPAFQPLVDAPPVAEPRRSGKRSSRLSDSAEIQARLVTGASSSVSLEQYRRLAAVLHEEQVQGKLKSVMVTSALPTEGKTLTLVNLALTLSGSYGRRVLLIDADLRAPSLHRLLEIRNTRGLSEALREGGRDLPIVEVATGLSVLTAGRPGPTPLAELTSERMGNVIRDCSASFDWVLIDTPPVGLLPDAQVLARIVGAVVFVIAAGSTPAAAVERAIAEVGPDSIIGTVLNRVEDRRIPEANYYNEYYGDHDSE
jgi:capsular exopolysaccharide synthesis family protein